MRTSGMGALVVVAAMLACGTAQAQGAAFLVRSQSTIERPVFARVATPNVEKIRPGGGGSGGGDFRATRDLRPPREVTCPVGSPGCFR